MRKIYLAAALACSLAFGGCAQWTAFTNKVETVVDAVASAKVPAKTILVAATTFNGVEKAMEGYLRLPICNGSTSACRNPAYTQPVIQNVRKGRSSRDTLVQFLKDHPDQLGPKGTYDALVAATSVLQTIMQNENIGGAK